MKKIEAMQMNVKVEIKTTNQICKKFFEEHTKRIDLYDIVFKNIEVQMRQLTQAIQSKNTTIIQIENEANSKEKEQCLAIQAWKTK